MVILLAHQIHSIFVSLSQNNNNNKRRYWQINYMTVFTTIFTELSSDCWTLVGNSIFLCKALFCSIFDLCSRDEWERVFGQNGKVSQLLGSLYATFIIGVFPSLSSFTFPLSFETPSSLSRLHIWYVSQVQQTTFSATALNQHLYFNFLDFLFILFSTFHLSKTF